MSVGMGATIVIVSVIFSFIAVFLERDEGRKATTIDALRPCPFCGSSVSMDVRLIEPNWWAACVMCDGINDHICSCQMIVSGDTKQQAIECAIKSWNRRV